MWRNLDKQKQEDIKEHEGQSNDNKVIATEQQQMQSITGDTGTAGSICLLLQTALPSALLGKGSSSARTFRLDLKGGTNASMAPQYDYWERVFWPTLRDQCGLDANQVEAAVLRRGFFPRGGGHVQVKVHSILHTNRRPLKPIQLTQRGDVSKIYIRSFHAGKLPQHLAHTMTKTAKNYFQERFKDVADIEAESVTEHETTGSGLGLLIIATTTTGCLLAGSALSSPKKKAKDVALEACDELFSILQNGGCVDDWLQDQLILFMALAEGCSEVLTGSLTLHTQTAIWIAEEMSGAKFEVTRISEGEEASNTFIEAGKSKGEVYGKDGHIPGKHLIRCQGIGLYKN
jgi:RNA 3'-terminal phosphate cyclase (ATP)